MCIRTTKKLSSSFTSQHHQQPPAVTTATKAGQSLHREVGAAAWVEGHRSLQINGWADEGTPLKHISTLYLLVDLTLLTKKQETREEARFSRPGAARKKAPYVDLQLRFGCSHVYTSIIKAERGEISPSTSEFLTY